MKKSYFDYITFSCYKYAPESFQAYFKGIKIQFNSNDISELGYLYITKGKQEVLKRIKQIYRKYSIFSSKENNKRVLAIRTSDNNYINLTTNYGHNKVNIYNISEKLAEFKQLKAEYNKNNFTIQCQTGIMNSYGKLEKTKTEQLEKPILLNRIIFI